MKKSKKIIRDLKNLKGNKIFGHYPTSNQTESKNLHISAFDIIRGLAKYEIYFKKEYKIDFDDVVYNDEQGNYELLDFGSSDNSFNWSSAVTFNFDFINIDGRDLITVKFHRYGDVRGNYTDYMVLDMSKDDFYEAVLVSSTLGVNVKYKGVEYSISTDGFKSYNTFDIYSDSIDLYDVYLDIDNPCNLKSIKKALVEYLKENV